MKLIEKIENIMEKFPEFREFAEAAIENATEGDVAQAAYLMYRDYDSSREWAEQQIERGIGDVVLAARWMCKHCDSSKKWYKKVTGKKFK